MGKDLRFSIKGTQYSSVPVKLDRKKLYGWHEKIAYDEDGKECTQAYTDESGALVIPRGGVGLGILSPEGEWIERGSLKAVRLDGNPEKLTVSSFSVTIDLNKTVSPDEFLNYTISAAYQLKAGEDFFAAVGNKIWTFPYIYRDGYETSPAFILQSGESIFMLLGYDTGFEMLSLNQAIEIDEEENPFEDEDEEIDFSMI
jgi:hypothetical protein